MESIAIALPSAFMACVQCFELVQFGRNFKEDFAVSAADLKICEIHLLRWGAAAGLDESGGFQLQERLSRYPEDQLQKAVMVLKRIAAIFETTKESCRFDSLDDDEDPRQSEQLDETAHLQNQQKNIQKSHQHLDKIKARYKSVANAVKGSIQTASDRTKWALYKKKHLTALVEQVTALIDRLEKLFPELLEVERKMAKQEVEGAEEEVIQTLPAMATKIDPLMVEALTAELKSKGMTFADVEAGEYVRAHLGNVYAPGEKSTGHDDHSFAKLRLSGHARFHGGNVYGARSAHTGLHDAEDGAVTKVGESG